MWLAERDACSEARATIRMSRYSLYTAVRRRGGAPGRPLHRSAPPGSARSRSRAASARSASGRSSLQISVSGLISGPTAGCRRDDVARARRAYARGRNGRDACNGRVAGVGPAIAGCDVAARLAGGTAAYRLSLILAIERKKSTLSHIAPRGEPLSFLRRSV